MKFSLNIEKSIEIIIMLSIVAGYLFFLPLTTEYYESAKVIFFLVSMMLVSLLWVYRTFENKTVFLVPSNHIFPSLIFLVVVTLSFLFTQDSILSGFGYFGRFINSYPFLLLIIFGIFVVTNNTFKRSTFHNYFTASVVGATLLSIFVITQNLGMWSSMLPGVDFLQNPSFNPVGSAVVLPFIFILNLPLIIGLYRNSIEKKIFYGVAIFFLVLGFFYTAGNLFSSGSLHFLIFGIISVLTILIAFWNRINKSKEILIILGVAILAGFLMTNIGTIKNVMGLEEPYQTETLLSQGTGYQILGDSLTNSFKNALVGSGPDTYIETFSLYKPLEFNQEPTWGVRFSRGPSEYMEMISNLGIIAFIVFAWIVLQTLYMGYRSIKRDQDNLLLRSVFAALILLVSMGFLINFITAVWVLLIIMLVYVNLIYLEKLDTDTLIYLTFRTKFKDQDVNLAYWAFTIVMVGLVVLGGIYFGGSYVSDTYLKASNEAVQGLESASREEQSEKLDTAISHAETANSWNRSKSYVHRQIAATKLLKFELNSTDENADPAVLNKLIADARRETDIMLALTPKNIESWENAAVIYDRLNQFSEGGYRDELITLYTGASELDPNKPQIMESLGLLYARNGEFERARTAFEEAIRLKPDFYRTYISLSEMYEIQGSLADASLSLQVARELLNPEDPLVQLIDQKIAELQAVIDEQTPEESEEVPAE